jgi:hypothetical protein
MAQVSSISRVGTTEPYYLQVARNQISFHKSIFKFVNNTTTSAVCRNYIYTK